MKRMSKRNPLILTIEDDEDMARLNERFLKRQGYDVVVANTAAEARSHFKENFFDLLIIDIELPDGDGLSLCEEFRHDADVPVLFLTGRTKTDDKVKGLNAGGNYYLTKPYDRDEFLAVIRSLLRKEEQTRKRISKVTVIERGPLVIKLREGKAYINGRDTELTPKEFAVLLVLVQNEERELPYSIIFEKAWGIPMGDDSRALRQQISRLKKKLDEENTDAFSILNKHGKGYIFTVM